MTDHETDADAESAGPSFPRWLRWALLGALGILIVGYGIIFLYAKVINDGPDQLGTSDLDAALSATTTTTTIPATTVATTSDPVVATTPETPASDPAPEPSTAPAADGVWTATDASQLGYRVKEVLFGVDTEAVGRTDQVDGTITIDGTTLTAAEFTVDVASITSDESRRDNQFRGRIMSADEFPTASFVLTEPVELGTEPVEGAEVETQATGDLTLHGVTNEVTFDVTAKVTNGQIGVLGSIPVVFADYGIDNPSTGGITTEDHGLVEFVLVFAR